MVVGKVPPWTAVRQLSRKTRKVSTGRPGLDFFLLAMLVPALPLCYCHLVPSIGCRCSPMGPLARTCIAAVRQKLLSDGSLLHEVFSLAPYALLQLCNQSSP